MRLCAICALLPLLLACPGPAPKPDAGVDAGVVITPVELCERLAAARCELKTRCYTAFARAAADSCGTIENSLCLAGYEALRESFENELVTVDPVKLSSCEERMRSSSCPPSFPPDYVIDIARPFKDCDLDTGLLIGKVPSGQTCTQPVECSPGTVCVKPGGVCRGTCSTSPKEGEGCAFGCAAGLICGTDGNCRQPKILDDACQTSAECEPELICLGTCRPRRKLSESCVYDENRLSQCEPGLACDVVPFVDGASGTCVKPKPELGSCRFHWTCQPGLVCADIDWAGFPQATPSAGSCRAPDGLDFNCPRTQYGRFVGDQCGPGLSCRQDLGKCKPLSARGEACTPSIQNCAGFDTYCKPGGGGDVGTCTGPASVGDTCAFTIDASRTVTIPCTSGYCDQQSTQQCRPPTKPIGALCEENGECTSNRCAVQQDRSLRCAQAC